MIASASPSSLPVSSMPRVSSVLALITPDEVREFFPEPLLTQLREVAGEFRLLDPRTLDRPALGRELEAANPEVLLACWKTPLLPDVLPPRLRYVCYLAGSVKRLVTRRHLEQGLRVTNWGGSIARTVAEAALFHILACLRNASHWAIAMHQPGVAAWKCPPVSARSLFGRSVGLHGFGAVARELIALLRPWGAPVSVFAPDLTAELAEQYQVQRVADLETLFAQNDIIVELAPLIPETTGLITERLLRLIRPGGVFVNVGRGAVVDEDALLRVAREGHISIGLDVFTTEPLPADSGFRALPAVSLTPHIAGPTIDHYPEAGAFALENLRAFAAGRPLQALMTPAIYDGSS
jgi:phosphoglycerate dehydrogenase-like enzyme